MEKIISEIQNQKIRFNGLTSLYISEQFQERKDFKRIQCLFNKLTFLSLSIFKVNTFKKFLKMR